MRPAFTHEDPAISELWNTGYIWNELQGTEIITLRATIIDAFPESLTVLAGRLFAQYHTNAFDRQFAELFR